MRPLFLSFALLLSFNSNAQAPASGDSIVYQVMMSPADSLRNAGNIDGALKAFAASLAKNPNNGLTLYNYACLLSVDYKLDSCFALLNRLLLIDSTVYALTDPDFLHAREDKRWASFEDQCIWHAQLATGKRYKDLEYARKLWKMKAFDQAYYSELTVADKAMGKHNVVSIALWDLKEKLNKQNQQDLEALVAQKGWPKISEVGESAASSAFLIVQHADHARQKKYLPIIASLCRQKEASWESYALMYDRIQMYDKKPQRYGSQVSYNTATKKYEVYNLEDETKVDQWRKDLGMQPLGDYLALWDIKFEPKKKH